MTISIEEDEKQANARYFFWKQCIELLNKLLGSKDLNAGAAFTSFDNCQMIIEGDTTLWEDIELQGFVPLLPAQKELDYSITPARIGLRDKKEQQVRVQRLLAAGKTIATAFSGTGRGIAYNKETGKFYLAGNMNDDKASVNRLIIAKEVAESDQGISGVPNTGYVGELKENKVAGTDAFPQSVNGDEDDEEYIVFKPVPKDVSALNTMRFSANKESSEASFDVPTVTSTAFQRKLPLEKSEMYTISNEYSPGAVSHGYTQYPMCSFSDFLPDALLQGDSMGLNHDVTQGQSVTEIGCTLSSPMHSLVGTTISSVFPSPGNASPACQGELQLNKQNSFGGPLSALPNLTLSSWGIQNRDVMPKGGLGNSKIDSPGIIGQQKLTDMSLSYWNTQIDVPSLSGLSDLSINDLVSSQAACEKYSMASNFSGLDSQNDRSQHSGIPSNFSTDSPFSVARPHPSAPLLPEENNINSSLDISTGIQHMNQSRNVSVEAKGINSAYPMQLECADVENSSLKTFLPSFQPVAKENPGRSWMGPSAIGRPPGFGSTRFMSGQSDEDAEAPPPVDDYAWLDGYSSGMPGTNSERYGNWGLPMYSSDNGIWTSGDKLPVSPNRTGFPFPGTGLSGFGCADDQQQQKTLDLQFYEQLLHEQQNKWFDYGTESKPLQFGTLQSLYEAQQQSESQKQLLLLQQKQQEWYRRYHMGGPFAS